MISCLNKLKAGDVVWTTSRLGNMNQYKILEVIDSMYGALNLMSGMQITASADSFSRIGALRIVKAK